MDMDWASLPRPALVQVFKNLSVGSSKSRSVCLVCSSWAAAAAAATTEIELSRENSTSAASRSLQLYLKKHGSNIKKLHAQHIKLRELCCPCLTELLLGSGSRKQLSRGSKLCSDIAAATGLTRLSLPDVDLSICSPQLLSALASLSSSLKHLALKSLSVLQAGSLLPACSRLTYLEIQRNLEGSALTRLSCLTNLQHLAVGICVGSAPPALAALQALHQLTCLAISRLNSSISASNVPGFSKLTALQHLSVSLTSNGPDNFPIDPAVLPAAVQLQHLELRRVNVDLPADDGAAFLAWLGKLEHLTSLTLWMVDGAQYSLPITREAITASTGLQVLDLSHSWLDADTHPPRSTSSVWCHIFKSGKRLPQLRTLKLQGTFPPPLTTDIQHVTQCCPALQQLDLQTTGWSHPVSLRNLLQLSALTDFSVSRINDSLVADCLAQLTELRQMRISGFCAELTEAGFQQLTALKQLTCLRLGRSFEAPKFSCEVLAQMTAIAPHKGWAIISKAPAGCHPDVWSQLAAAYQKLGQTRSQGQ